MIAIDINAGQATAGSEDYARLVRDEGKYFRVNTSAYTDEGILRAEEKLIFEKTWGYLCHESEIPEAGDYRTTYIGRQPILVVRGRDGIVRAFINRCVHRGAALCRDISGRARAFVCPYHGWSYDLAGNLMGITDRNVAGGYAEDFDAPKGLFTLPRCETYRGFVFGNLNAKALPLRDYLGRSRDVIDQKLNMSPVGEIRIRARPYIVRYEGNWKFSAENIVDQYHFMYVHSPFSKLQTKFGDTTGDFGVHKGGNAAAMKSSRYHGSTWGTVQGHGLLLQPEINLEKRANSNFAEVFEQLSETHDEETMSKIAGKAAASIFPSLGIIHHQIRTWRPLGPELTEVIVYPYELVGIDDALNAGMLRSQERFYGPAGYGMPDDVDIFSQNAEGLRGSSVEWLILERGMPSDERDETGDTRGLATSEAPQRGFWRAWVSAMRGELN
ncbi:aromatic ring-hydroxylating oxygenase subunit alpha [Amorphus sp. MBR-141]